MTSFMDNHRKNCGFKVWNRIDKAWPRLVNILLNIFEEPKQGRKKRHFSKFVIK
jgi:hypothetical protein